MIIHSLPRLHQSPLNDLREVLLLPASSLQSLQLAAQLIQASKESRPAEYHTAYPLFTDVADMGSGENGQRGLLRTTDGISDLLNAAFEVIDIDYFVWQMWTDALSAFREDVEEFAQGAPARKLNERPHKEDNILADFLSNTRRAIGQVEAQQGEVGEGRWRNLCLAAYRATRLAVDYQVGKTEAIRRGRAERSAFAVKVAIQYLPSESFELEGIQLTVASGAIADAIRARLRHARSHNEKYAHSTAKNHFRYAAWLLSGRTYPWKGTSPHAGIRTHGGRGTRARSPYAGTETDRWSKQRREQIEEGAAPSEFDLPVDTPTRRSAPRGTANRSLATRPAGKLPSWAQRYLTAETLGFVIAWLAGDHDITKPQPLRRAALAFTLTQLSYGFNAKLLFGANISTRPSDAHKTLPSSALFYEQHAPDRATFYVTPRGRDRPKVFASESDKPDLYVPCSSVIALPAPTIVARCLARGTARSDEPKEVFAIYDETQGGWIVLDEHNVNDLLQPLEAMVREKVDVGRIGRSAEVLLEETAGMDELVAAIIRGEIPRILASQTHYTNIAAEDIRRVHLDAYRNIFRIVSEASRSVVIAHDLRPLKDLFAGDSDETTSGAASCGEQERIGSPFVPRTDLLSKYLDELRHAVSDTKDWRLRFNRFTAYTVLLLQHLTGMRPDELKRLLDQRIQLDHQSALAVDAKINQKYREWRSLELAPLAAQQLDAYRTARADVLHRVWVERLRSDEEVDRERREVFFFFLSRRYLPRPVTTNSLRQYLQSTEETGITPYEWRLNSPRHMYRTTAVEMKVPSAVIDALMGHLTRGRESLGYYSHHDWIEEQQFANSIAAEVSERLGLKLVTPKGD